MQAVFNKIVTLFPAKIKEVFLLYQYPEGEFKHKPAEFLLFWWFLWDFPCINISVTNNVRLSTYKTSVSPMHCKVTKSSNSTRILRPECSFILSICIIITRVATEIISHILVRNLNFGVVSESEFMQWISSHRWR